MTTLTPSSNGLQESNQGTQDTSTTRVSTHTSKRSRMITTPPRSMSRTITRLPFYSSSPNLLLKDGKTLLSESEKQDLCGKLFTSPGLKSEPSVTSSLSEMTLSGTRSSNIGTQMEIGHSPLRATSEYSLFTEEQIQEKPSGLCTALRIRSLFPTWTTSEDGQTNTMESFSMTCPLHICPESRASTYSTGRWIDPSTSDTRPLRSQRKRARFSPPTRASSRHSHQMSLEPFAGVSPRSFTSKGLHTGSPTDNWMRIKLKWNKTLGTWEQHKRSNTPSP